MEQYVFLLKKILGDLLMPVPMILLLLCWALLLLLRRKTRWLGYLTIIFVTALLFVASYAPLSNQLISLFESRIPQYQQGDEPVDYVAVLGSWHQTVTTQPITSEIKPAGVVRLAEGIRIYRMNPGSKLVFTGFKGIPEDVVSYPDKLRALAISLGVPAEDIIVLNGPQDTQEEARLLASKYAHSALVLVTTALHMPRALLLCQQAGLNPIPAPTNYLSKPFSGWWTFPSAATLAHTEYWAHEQLGILWSDVVKQIELVTAKNKHPAN